MNGLGKAYVKRTENGKTMEVREIPLNEFLRYRRSGWPRASKEEFDAYSRQLSAEKAAAERKRRSKPAAGGTGGDGADEQKNGESGDENKKAAVETKGKKKGAAGK